MPAVALLDKKSKLAIQLSRGLDSRLSQVARPSCQSILLWKNDSSHSFLTPVSKPLILTSWFDYWWRDWHLRSYFSYFVQNCFKNWLKDLHSFLLPSFKDIETQRHSSIRWWVSLHDALPISRANWMASLAFLSCSATTGMTVQLLCMLHLCASSRDRKSTRLNSSH